MKYAYRTFSDTNINAPESALASCLTAPHPLPPISCPPSPAGIRPDAAAEPRLWLRLPLPRGCTRGNRDGSHAARGGGGHWLHAERSGS